MVGRKGDYLFRKPGSDVWRIRLQYPKETGKPEIRRSLGTTDRAVAEIMAMPMIQAHKLDIIRETQRVSIEALLQEFPMFRLPADGVAREPAPGAETAPIEVVEPPAGKIITKITTVPPAPVAPPVTKPRPIVHELVKRAKPVPMSNDDQRMLDAFLSLKSRNRYYEGEARNEWNAFRAFVGGRAMKDCTRQDGRAYAEHLFGKGLKTATVVKRINYLSAPLSHDATFTDSRPNPFDRAVVAREDDATEVPPFTDDDMTLCRDHMLPKLRRNEKLLWLICATTGMRHSEAFQIDREYEFKGIRYVKIGGKTKSSRRDVPLPDCLTAHPEFPAKIDKPIFSDNCKNVSKNLLRALRRVGIEQETGKNVYSLRHRAHAKLRRMKCEPYLQRKIVGHTLAHKDVKADDHDRYGQECIVDMLKPYVDQIGY